MKRIIALGLAVTLWGVIGCGDTSKVKETKTVTTPGGTTTTTTETKVNSSGENPPPPPRP